MMKIAKLASTYSSHQWHKSSIKTEKNVQEVVFKVSTIASEEKQYYLPANTSEWTCSASCKGTSFIVNVTTIFKRFKQLWT